MLKYISTPMTTKNYDFSPPLSFGILPEDLFNEMEDILFRSGMKERIIQHRPGDAIKLRRESLMRAVSGLTDSLLAHFSNKGHEVKNIVYTFDNNPIPTNKTQRKSDWHQDSQYAGSLVGIYTAANSMPTDILVHTKNTDSNDYRLAEFIDTHAYRAVVPALGQSAVINEGIRQGVYEVYHPKVNEGVLMLEQFHQSPKNLSAETIKRMWLRISLLGIDLDELMSDPDQLV